MQLDYHKITFKYPLWHREPEIPIMDLGEVIDILNTPWKVKEFLLGFFFFHSTNSLVNIASFEINKISKKG